MSGHPYNSDREDKVAKRRVSAIAGVSGGAPKHYATGGAVKGYAEGGEVIPNEIATRAEGGKVKARADRPTRAKGGRVGKGGGKKGHKTNVNVIVAPSGGPQAGLGPKPPMPMPPPPAAPPALPPMAAKPPMPPMPAGPGGPPPMPMRARGGKVSGADQKGVTGIGDRTPVQHSGNKSDTQNIGRGNVITKAKGGRANGGVSTMTGDTYPNQTPLNPPPYQEPKSPTDSAGDAPRRKGLRATGGGVTASDKARGAKRDLDDAMESKSRDPRLSGDGPTRYATGGPVEHSAKMGPKYPGGGRGGASRLAKAHRQARKGGLAQSNVAAAVKAGQEGL